MTPRPILITGGTVLAGSPLTGDFQQADVLVENGSISAIGQGLQHPDAERIDASGTFVLPGFVDTHAHLWESTMRGVTAEWDLLDFAWGIRFNHAGLHGPEDLYAGAHAGALALLDGGTTTVLDHVHCVISPDHADEALRAVVDSGVRAVWAYGLSDVPVPEPAFRTRAQRWDDVRRVRAAVSGTGRVVFGVAPTDITGVPWQTTVEEFALARELDAVLTTHLHSVWGPGRAPEAEWLHHDGLLGPRQVYSHANAISDRGLARLADAGAAIASTPESELQMGLGFPVFARAAAASVTVGLGSDLQANHGPDAFTQMRLARQAEVGRHQQALLDTVGTAGLAGVPVSLRQVLHTATLGGAEALGLGAVTGSLEVGKAADLLLLRNDAVRQRPVVDPFATIVLQSHAGDVDTVLVAGEVRKRRGLLLADTTRSTALVEDAWERLLARMEQRGGTRPPRPEGLLQSMAAAASANVPAWAASV